MYSIDASAARVIIARIARRQPLTLGDLAFLQRHARAWASGPESALWDLGCRSGADSLALHREKSHYLAEIRAALSLGRVSHYRDPVEARACLHALQYYVNHHDRIHTQEYDHE